MERFKVLLLEISNKLSSDNLDKLKFLCQDKIGKKKTEEITTGIQLFEYLIQRAAIGPSDTQVLKVLLGNIGQNVLLDLIDQYEKHETPADPTDQTELEKINIATDVIVEHLGKKWRQLGRKLGVSDPKLEGIEDKHSRNLEEMVREVIREWKKMQRGQAKVDDLIKALRDCSQNYTADLVVKALQNASMA